MTIKNLKLTNFRNHLNFEIEFSPGATILIGPNGIGKTNILEALFILASAKSYRAKDERNLIYYNKNFAQITGKISDETTLDFFILLQELRIIKKVKINGLEKKFIDLAGTIKTVLFSPESLQIIAGAPVLRRRFLDLTLVQRDKNYAINLLELRKIIFQRNGLLKLLANKKARENELDFWDQKMIKFSQPIIEKRKKYLEYINQNINKYYQEIDPKTKKKLKLVYRSLVEDPDHYEEILASGREREILAQRTIYSPHLDDFLIFTDNQSFREISSRGELRSFMIALKMVEIDYLTSANNDRPIILLDDVFSELDKTRKNAILKIIGTSQSIITATDLDQIEKIKGAKIVDLGKIR